MSALDTIAETVADHRVDEFYAWHDLKQDARAVMRAGNDLLDSLDDIGAELTRGLDAFDFGPIETCDADLSRSALRAHVWE